jgi:Rieske Fe-S protein
LTLCWWQTVPLAASALYDAALDRSVREQACIPFAGCCAPAPPLVPEFLPNSVLCCLQSDATYLIVTDNGEIETYGLNAVCTHLGCVVPWNQVRQHPQP